MTKYIEQFITHDFRVFVKVIENGKDADEYVRSDEFNAETFVNTFSTEREDGFKFLMKSKFDGKDQVDIFREAKELTRILSNISDEGMKTIYSEWLATESKINKTTISSFFKELTEEKEQKSSVYSEEYFYNLPADVKTPIKELLPDIEKFQMFQANNKVYIQDKRDKPPYTFHAVTNFEIKIIQHMKDERFPKKLIWLKNVYGQEVIFDVLSSEINTPLAFENMVTNHGKFYWTGNRNDHQILKIYLFESMGTGRMIETLGWQSEGFWVWNNTVHVTGKGQTKDTHIPIDENGVFKHNNVSYYVPSANKAYLSNAFRYTAQKRVVSTPPKYSFEEYTGQMIKVHRQSAITALLFTVASMFQDVVVSELGFFPMLFFYGQPSSGKDQLAECCQSFFGKSQEAINLEGGVSTIKAQIREFAQFSNLISHLSEYKPGDARLDGVLKGLWDRRGYKRGTIESNVSTESIPILSSVILTGNHQPDQDSLITRLIWHFMDKNEHSLEEMKEYEKLADMQKHGISGYTATFLAYRETVEQNFKQKHREYKNVIAQRNPEANSRMITNFAVLGAFYGMFQAIVKFPFTEQQLLNYFDTIIDKQMRKLDSASVTARFWECFLASMRTGQWTEQIFVERDFKVEGEKLYFNFTSCYNRIQRQWYTQFHESAPAKMVISEALKSDNSWNG
ncbi:MAG TPA: DNA primase, partial [Crocinitomicaceae bacterium]|nr:DNA primase [Crocinitomicaceae bacterium]